MAVTVKTVKKKKPLSLKKGGAKADLPEGAEGAAEGAAAGGAPAAAPAQAPARAAPPVKKPSYTFAGVCAILEFLMFSAILTLQILEWRYYEAPPKNAFPPFGIGPEKIPIPTGTGVYTAPVDEEVEPFDEELEGDFVEDDETAPLDEAVPAE